MRQYLQIGPIAVSQASALAGGLFAGMPAIYAYTGFLVNLALKLSRRTRSQINPIAIAPAFTSFTLHPGHARYVRYRAGQFAQVKDKGPHHPTVDEPEASFDLSLCVVLDARTVLDSGIISETLRGFRLAGGTMASALPGSMDIVVGVVEQRTDILRGLPSTGVMLVDATDVLNEARSRGLDGMDALLISLKATASSADPRQDGASRPTWLPTYGRYLPGCVGCMPLEAPRVRAGARQADDATAEIPTLHAYGEAVFSLVRAQTVASVRVDFRQNPDLAPMGFWRTGVEVCSGVEVYGAYPAEEI